MNLKKFPLFHGIEEAEIMDMDARRCMHRRTFQKGDTVLHEGSRVRQIGLVLSGRVMIRHLDLWGNESILSHADSGHIFAESYALSGEPILVNVTAEETTDVLFLDVAMFTDPQYQNLSWYPKMLCSMLALSTRKNLLLSERIFCTGPKTVRGRLMIYLSSQASKAGRMDFTIPFNRQQLADYLNLDRSALSRELCRMRDEGILTFRKNSFHMLGE